MITEEQAKQLNREDKVHSCSEPGRRCGEWKVWTPYEKHSKGWIVVLKLATDIHTSAGISEASQEAWHLPGECSSPSRELKVDIYRVYDGVRVGSFYLSMDDSEEFLQKNAPALLKGAQIMAQEGLLKGV